MPNMTEPEPPIRRPTPLIWIGLVVAGLIVYIFLASGRGGRVEPASDTAELDNIGEIERSLLIPPGMQARQYIAQIRERGEPYPLQSVFEKGDSYQKDGSLADAHLLYFFSAREGYLPAMMRMGESSDPTIFRAEESLLDQANGIQAYKWYQKAAAMGHAPAFERIKKLRLWAIAESKVGNPDARLLVLNLE